MCGFSIAFSKPRRGDAYLAWGSQPQENVALIVDPESSLYLNAESPTSSELSLRLRNKLNRLGAPFEVYLFKDIPAIPDFKRYKCVVFNTPFEITEENLGILRDFVMKDGRPVVWLYAPGISDGKVFRPERVKEICGTPFGTPGINEVAMGSWRSVYVSNPLDLTPSGIKKIAAEADAKIYCAEELPVYANEKLLAVHTAKGGPLKISLPGR